MLLKSIDSLQAQVSVKQIKFILKSNNSISNSFILLQLRHRIFKRINFGTNSTNFTDLEYTSSLKITHACTCGQSWRFIACLRLLSKIFTLNEVYKSGYFCVKISTFTSGKSVLRIEVSKLFLYLAYRLAVCLGTPFNPSTLHKYTKIEANIDTLYLSQVFERVLLA